MVFLYVQWANKLKLENINFVCSFSTSDKKRNKYSAKNDRVTFVCLPNPTFKLFTFLMF